MPGLYVACVLTPPMEPFVPGALSCVQSTIFVHVRPKSRDMYAPSSTVPPWLAGPAVGSQTGSTSRTSMQLWNFCASWTIA